ncbi:glycosyltransferase [Gallibacterium salpingitidis]|uniref:Glycosyl transferase family 1 domain-containing protein n=1 Tax=Gallibacterium salpingitidis TaxID=505341 RepID=A0A1A7P0L6_9PAST|nr:glycosyltransferase [Gallibacterium salpingitidis]OBW95291.1 hypothetical protein QS62_04020 [Gallibacterium salpingitidis]
MRIVIDLQGMQTESRFRGIGRYSMSLVKAIIRNNTTHNIIVALSNLFPDTIKHIKDELRNLLPEENIKVWNAIGPVRGNDKNNEDRRNISELIRELFLASLEPDLVILTSLFEGHIDDAITSIKKIDLSIKTGVILYDLIPYINSNIYLEGDEVYSDYYLSKIEYLKKADILFAISESSRNEAINYLSIEPNRIYNISSSIDEKFIKTSVSENKSTEILHKYNVDSKFIMYAPGGFDIRKNFENLISAYGMLEDDIKSRYKLVIVSKIDDYHRNILLNFAKKAFINEDQFIITGYVTDSELVALYSNCDLFVFPSLHEGFGLPVLEAMSCGAIVIGSNTTSIPEVIGCKDALFDPNDPLSIKNKISEALIDDKLREKLKNHNKKQIQKFSWDISAKNVINIIEKNIYYEPNKIQVTLDFIIDKISMLAIGSDDDTLRKIASVIDFNFNTSLRIMNKSSNKHMIRLEGPFDSSYSLAIVNREFARALNSLGHTVILHSTEGPGDFSPNKEFLDKNKDIELLNLRAVDEAYQKYEIMSRNLYPPRVSDMTGFINFLHCYAWEESGFPQNWVSDFNLNLDGIGCTSYHVRKILIDNGVKVYLPVIYDGTSHWKTVISNNNYKLSAKGFRFLHVSSCFPRKGVDELLEAYGQAFSIHDDVSLIIKTFPNPHNNVLTLISEQKIRNEKYPEVIVIDEDLSDSSLKSLYEQCDVLVAPSKAEGFGLPMAEAMLSGLPVITTNWGGQLDFCNDNNSWLVDYEFEYAKTHFNLFGSVWAKINIKDLSAKLRLAFLTNKKDRELMAKNGRDLLISKFKWEDVGNNFIHSIEYINHNFFDETDINIGWITTWNTKCGIATYSSHLINNMKKSKISIFAPNVQNIIGVDEKNVYRCWSIGKEYNNFNHIDKYIEQLDINVIVIQFNYGFFNHEELSEFIFKCKKQGLIVIMMMHSTVDPVGKEPSKNFQLYHIKDALRVCDRLLVHSVSDLNNLKKINLVSNVAIFPHGVLRLSKNIKLNDNDIPIISSYGFCLPHKGLLELLDAVYILHQRGYNIRLNLINAEYDIPESKQLIQDIRKNIKEYSLDRFVTLNSNFLEDKQSLELLGQSDLIVFAHQNTNESSSAAVRYGLSTGKPVMVTPLNIFEDLGDSVFKTIGCSPLEIADSIIKVLDDIKRNNNNAQYILDRAYKWREYCYYDIVAKRLENICESLLINS